MRIKLKYLFFLFPFLLTCSYLSTGEKQYDFYDDPIDVVIPSTAKDLNTLNLCIAGIRNHCPQVRRVIVISSYPLTDQAEWFDEAFFPFSKEDVALHLLKGNPKAAQDFLKAPSRVGWYFQQLLKFYASFIIPDISSNVLMLDSDTIFLKPVKFLNDNLAGLYNTGFEYHKPYFEHAHQFLPGLCRLHPKYSGISHHMLFQRSVLQDLFTLVENHHGVPLWKTFCLCVNPKQIEKAGASEYEIYFNFVFSRTDQVQIQHLKWKNVNSIDCLPCFEAQGYHYISSHIPG